MKCPRCGYIQLRSIAGFECVFKHVFTAPPASPEFPFFAAPGAQGTSHAELDPYITGLRYQCGRCGHIALEFDLDIEAATRHGLSLAENRRSEEYPQAVLNAMVR